METTPTKNRWYCKWYCWFALATLCVIPIGCFMWCLAIVLGGGVSAHAQPPIPWLSWLLIDLPYKIVSPLFLLTFPDSVDRSMVFVFSLGAVYSYPFFALIFWEIRRRQFSNR